MKKFLIGIILILASILILPSSTVATANISEDNQVVVNTLYPEGVLDYHNLTNVNQITINNYYIAYSLDKTSINIFNTTTKQSIIVDEFYNIQEIKFITNNQLLVVDKLSKNGHLYIVSISEDSSYSCSKLIGINLNNLILIDIYPTNATIYIGITREVDNKTIFELYTIDLNSTSLTPTFHHSSIDEDSSYYQSATLLVVTDQFQYVIYNNEDNPYNPSRILINNHQANSTGTHLNTLNDIQTIRYYKSNKSEYILAFTGELLYILDTTAANYTTPVSSFSIVDMNIKEFTDIDIFDNNIIICDQSSRFIKSYTIDDTYDIIISNTNILLSSSDNSLGRFNSVSDVFVQGSTYYISDTKNNRIQIIDNLKCYEIADLETDSNPQNVLLDSKQNIFLTTRNTNASSSKILKYSQNNHNYSRSQTYSTYNETNIGLIADSTIDTLDNIYLIDYTYNNLLCLNSAGLQIKNSLDGILNSSSNTRIEYLKSLNVLVIYNNNEIKLFNLETFEILSTISINNCSDISVDFNSIYTLCNNEIKRINVNNNHTMQFSNKSLVNNTFSQFNCITCDIVTNQIFAFNTHNQSINYIYNSLTNNPFVFDNINDTTPIPNTHQPFAINIINNGIIYDQPYYLGNHYLNVTHCIGIDSFDNYYRILFNYNNTLKTGFIPKEFAQVLNHNTTKEISVIATNLQVPVYKYPTILKSSDTPVIISYIPINTYLNISYNPFPISIDNKQFYLYNNNGNIGYIFNADVVLNDNKHITYLNTENATISAIGEDTINVYAEDKTTIISKLNNNDRIYVESYDKHQEYTQIIYKDANLNTIKGYIKTNYIEMDELDNTKIILIIIIILSIVMLVIIITSYIIIRKRKQS